MMFLGVGFGLTLVPSLPDAQFCAIISTGKDTEQNKVAKKKELLLFFFSFYDIHILYVMNLDNMSGKCFIF
jgi:hypothetical protein